MGARLPPCRLAQPGTRCIAASALTASTPSRLCPAPCAQGDPSKFEGRIAGLLAAFRRLKLPPEVVGRFHLMGGECNYLLRVNPKSYGLEFVPDAVRGRAQRGGPAAGPSCAGC